MAETGRATDEVTPGTTESRLEGASGARPGVLGRSVLWAAGWGLGAGIGVALGAYLTATSGAGAPGVDSLDTGELVRLPALAGGLVFVAAFAIYAIRLSADRRTKVHRDEDPGDGDAEHHEISAAH